MSNSIFGIQSEIELASSIAAAVKAKGGHWNQLALECCQGPSLKKGDQYKAIAKFVRSYSGALAATSYCIFEYMGYVPQIFSRGRIVILHFLQSIHVTYMYACMYLCTYVFTMYENSLGAGDLIPFLSAFSKERGASVALGQDFLCAITDANFQKNDVCPTVGLPVWLQI